MGRTICLTLLLGILIPSSLLAQAVDSLVEGPSVQCPQNGTVPVSISCPSGYKVVSGGWERSGGSGELFVPRSLPANSALDQWLFEFRNPGAATSTVNTFLIVRRVSTPTAVSEVSTASASNVGSTSATVNGSVNPNSSATSAWFEWGTSSTLSTYSTTASQSVGSGSSAVSITANLTGLTPNTTYYYRAVAQNSAGTQRGLILSFTTASTMPTVSTTPAISVMPTSAMLTGSVNPNGSLTTAWFEWGTSSTLFSYSTTPSESIGSGTSAVTVWVTLAGLSPNTAYYYRVVGQNSAGTRKGTILTFTTSVATLTGEYSVDANTVLLLHLNETSGSSVLDASSYSNNGTTTGTTIVDGRFGKARKFNGVSDNVQIQNSQALNLTGSQISLEAWINLTGRKQGKVTGIISKGGNELVRGYELDIDDSQPQPQVHFVITTNSPTIPQTRTLNSETTLELRRWYHIAGTYDGTTQKVYINGALDRLSTYQTAENVKGGTDGLYVGQRTPGNNFADYTNGLIDEVRISNKARSPEEFNLQLPPKNLTATPSGASINLSWQNGGGAVGLLRYKVYRGADSTNIVLIDSTTSTSYSNSGLTTSTRYFYRVSAVDSTDFEGAKSYAVSAIIPAAIPTINLTTTSLSFGTVTVGTSAQRTFTVQNIGTAALVVSSVTTSNIQFSVSQYSFSIGAGGSQTITVTFTPAAFGSFSGTIILTHNAAGSPSTISVSGWGVAASSPATFTDSVSNVTPRSAVVWASVNPFGTSTRVWFEWGRISPRDTSLTVQRNVGSGDVLVVFSDTLERLLPNTGYYFRVVSENASGQAKGIERQFTTSSSQEVPFVSTLGATSVTSTSATLNGTVNPNGSSTTAFFEWGTSSTLSGFSTTSPQSIGSGTSSVSVTTNLTGLAANTTYYFRVVGQNSAGTQRGSAAGFTTLSTKTVTSPGISFPSNPSSSTDYRLVSFPGTTPLNVSQVLSGAQNTDWRVFRDNGGSIPNHLTELSGPSPVSVGEGYWLLKKGTFNFSQTVTMPQLSSDGTYTISVRNGWNIIGNPFDVGVPWSSIINANGLSSNLQLSAYTGPSGFQPADVLEPFKAYYCNLNVTSLKIPYPFPSLKLNPLPAPQIDWQVQLVLETEINTDAENHIGIAPSAKPDLDELDQPKPPLVFDQGFLYFSRPSWDSRYGLFNSDFRPSIGDGQVWDFEVSNPRKSTCRVRFSGVDKIPAEYDVILLNERSTTRVDLREKSTYEFQPVAEKTPFGLMVGKKSYVEERMKLLVPQEFELTQNYPNPFNPSTAIAYKVPRDAVVRVEVLSMLGQRVAILAEGSHAPGVYTVTWNASDGAHGNASSGVYFCRLCVDGKPMRSIRMTLLR